MRFKLAGAQLLLNVSGKDADDGDKDDGTSQVVAFGVESGLVIAIVGLWFVTNARLLLATVPSTPIIFLLILPMILYQK